MKRALINACVGLALAAGYSIAAAAQTMSSSSAVHHPASIQQPAAAPQAHITPSTMPTGQTSIEIGSYRWTARGYSLKMLISQIYDIELTRIDVADNFDVDTRYDVTLSLPRDADETATQQMLTNALQKKFNISITPETRAMNVYVMSAPGGAGNQLHLHSDTTNSDDAGQITYSGRDCPGVSSHAIEASATTISDFGRALEQDLDGVLVNETKLLGSYDFKLGSYANTGQLLTMLHDQLGLVVRPLQRQVTVLKVQPQGELASL